MVFASPVFLSAFLPLTYLLCLLLRRSIRAQNACLLGMSLLFFAWGGLAYALLLVMSALVNWLLARCIEGTVRPGVRRFATVLAVVLNMGMLFGFKYAGFAVRSVNALFSAQMPVPEIALPLGISFFTFQAMSYVLDVRMGQARAAKYPWQVLLYLALFPQLIAGPIVQWRQFEGQLARREMTLDGTAKGMRRLIVGLSKKVLLADILAQVADAAFAAPPAEMSALFGWLGAVAYTLQIYLDFSGYSDMAIGMGWMLGFSFPENFDRPLAARSMRDFWRRWHMTLTGWFRAYVYVPLGGNRGGTGRTLRNLMLVFLLTGLWHGAAWTFVLWGLWHGLFIVLERAGVLRVSRWPRPLAHLYTCVVVVLGFVWFRADSLAVAWGYMRGLFTGFAMTDAAWSALLWQLTPMHVAALVAGLLVSWLPRGGGVKLLARAPWLRGVQAAACLGLLVLSYAAMIASGYHPFIYFRF